MGVREFVDDFPSFFLSVPLCGYSGGLRDPFATTEDTEGTEGEGRSRGDGINGCLRNPRIPDRPGIAGEGWVSANSLKERDVH